MILAALVGRYLTVMLSGGINGTPVKLITGIGLGLLAGWIVGLFVKHTSGRFIRTSSDR